MHRFKNILAHAWFWPGLVLAAAILLRVALGAVSLSHLPATGDEASSVIWAESIARGARPLLFVGQPYQFPFESYLMAPLTDWMPNNAFGARYQAFLLGGLSLGVLLWAAFQLFPKGRRWPSVTLLLLPSAYWLQHQAGYTPPQYAMSAFLGALIIAFSIRAWRLENTGIWVFLAGVCGGLLFSNHILGLSMITGSAFFLMLRDSLGRSAKSSVVYLLGLGLGLVPYLAGELTIPGANDAVSGHLPFSQLYQRLADFALTQVLPGALGINITLFTDVHDHLGWPPILRKVFLGAFITVFLWAAWAPVKSWSRALLRRRFPRRHPIEMFLAATVSAVILLALSTQGADKMYRFLLPAAWCAPFIVGYVFGIMPTMQKKVLAPMIVLLASANLIAGGQMIWRWAQPGYLQQIANNPDMEAVYANLTANGDEHCYASFWFSYRITYETHGDITCAMPYNERFPNWPYPFKAKVDEASAAPYILTTGERSILTSVQFKTDLENSGISAQTDVLEPFKVFRGFGSPGYNQVSPLPMETMQIQASSNDSADLAHLVDDDIDTFWSSIQPQRTGMYTEVSFPEPMPVQRITLAYNPAYLNFPYVYNVLGKKNGEWELLLRRVHRWVRLQLYKDKPIYQAGLNYAHAWVLNPEPVEAIRVEITMPEQGKAWDLAELELAMPSSLISVAD